MPIYAVKCDACGHQGDDFHKMSEPHAPCPKCGGVCHTDIGNQRTVNGNRIFVGEGRRSLQFGFSPAEVQEARQLFGSTGATIDDDGDVLFDDRAQERAFRRRYASMLHKAEKERQQQATQECDNTSV